MSNYTDEQIKHIADSIAKQYGWRICWEIYKLMAPWILIGFGAMGLIDMAIQLFL